MCGIIHIRVSSQPYVCAVMHGIKLCLVMWFLQFVLCVHSCVSCALCAIMCVCTHMPCALCCVCGHVCLALCVVCAAMCVLHFVLCVRPCVSCSLCCAWFELFWMTARMYTYVGALLCAILHALCTVSYIQ